ncbi:Helix-turn-helix domain-containing protein [Modicisalibacter ilicicola DSM 19980]|uniref:Helix-turn-helix domain-containing protein n=1 Tax=Modicisalibacter ilicicola DSM 19980 TaxID=1121942 RepID=A0A1M4S8P2_9GAMM|nr:AraC family transcriptional regulator [Halomonas ilicicola]SHE28574.1 Helix-turn-helix domain-containing protein [Halomonas ilicicola DSM 19980]
MNSVIRLTPLDNTTRHHAHAYHQIVVSLDGHAEFEIEGLGGRIAPLNGCVVPADHVHYYEGIGPNRQLIFDLPDDAPAVSGNHRELARLFDAPRFFALDDSLRTYLDFLVAEVGQPRHAPGELLTTTFLGCLHSRLPLDRPPADAPRINLATIDRFIHAHLAKRLSVADLARLVCLSEAHFSECFRKQTGLAPYQYLLRQRLAVARRLLTTTRLPLSEVAARSGFTHQSALSRAFRRAFDQTPSQLRRGGSPVVEVPGHLPARLPSNS